MNDSNWRDLEYSVCDAVGKMKWTPAMNVMMYHAHQDVAFGKTTAFRDRHINFDTSFDLQKPVTRESKGMDEHPRGVHVSIAAMTSGELYNKDDGKTAHNRDWDFIVEQRDNVLREKGLSDSDDVMAKIKALADYVQTHRGSVYEGRHGVDTLLHSSYCVGAANVNAAFASTMGLPFRTINTSSHSTTEVEIKGSWYWIENTPGRPTLLSDSVMNLIVHPEQCEDVARDKEYMEKIRAHNPSNTEPLKYAAIYNLSSIWWHFNQGGCGADKYIRCSSLLNGAGVAVGLDCTTARALYPNVDSYLIKPTDSGALLIAGKYTWYYSGLVIRSGQSIRRSFFLGEINDPDNPVSQGLVDVMLIPNAKNGFDGAGWFFAVNNTVFPLNKNLENWSLISEDIPLDESCASNPAGLSSIPQKKIRLVLPVEALKANSINTVEFGCQKEGVGKLEIMIFPDPVRPYAPPFNPGEEEPPRNLEYVKTDHICELLKVMGFEHQK